MTGTDLHPQHGGGAAGARHEGERQQGDQVGKNRFRIGIPRLDGLHQVDAEQVPPESVFRGRCVAREGMKA